jgi:hypothetical protein
MIGSRRRAAGSLPQAHTTTHGATHPIFPPPSLINADTTIIISTHPSPWSALLCPFTAAMISRSQGFLALASSSVYYRKTGYEFPCLWCTGAALRRNRTWAYVRTHTGRTGSRCTAHHPLSCGHNQCRTMTTPKKCDSDLDGGHGHAYYSRIHMKRSIA